MGYEPDVPLVATPWEPVVGEWYAVHAPVNAYNYDGMAKVRAVRAVPWSNPRAWYFVHYADSSSTGQEFSVELSAVISTWSVLEEKRRLARRSAEQTRQLFEVLVDLLIENGMKERHCAELREQSVSVKTEATCTGAVSGLRPVMVEMPINEWFRLLQQKNR